MRWLDWMCTLLGELNPTPAAQRRASNGNAKYMGVGLAIHNLIPRPFSAAHAV